MDITLQVVSEWISRYEWYVKIDIRQPGKWDNRHFKDTGGKW